MKKSYLTHALFGMLLLFTWGACTNEEADSPIGYGEGRLSLSQIEVELSVMDSPSTKGTLSSYDAPQPEELTYTITHTVTAGSKVYSYSELMASPVLAVGQYTLTATYGTASMGTTPYLYYSTTFTIQGLQTTTLPSFSVPLACAIIRPYITDLLPHFKDDVHLSLCDESGTTIAVTNLSDYYVPAGHSYTLSISGTNQLGESKTMQGSISQVAAKTRYILNCSALVPVFSMPNQPDYNAWSYHIDFTPLTASQISDAAGISTDKILNNLIYEYSADGGNSWQAFTGTRLTNLTPNTTYTFRARFGAVYSTNHVTLTTEGAEPVPNGDFEDLVQTISVTEMDQGGEFRAGAIDYQNWATFTVNEPTGWASINAKTCYKNASCKNTWFTIPSTYATNISWTTKWGIVNSKATPDIYKDLSAQNGQTAMILRNVAWDSNGVKPSRTGSFGNTTYYCTNVPSIANRSAARLFLGSYDYDGSDHFNEGVAFKSRPIKLCGYYKYQDYQSNEQPTVSIQLLHESTPLYTTCIELPNSASAYTYFEIPITYTIQAKVTQLKIMICSSNQDNIITTVVNGKKEACSRGAQLTIDNLTFTYD